MREKNAHSPRRDSNLYLWDTRPSCFRLHHESRPASRQSKQTLKTLTHQLHRETLMHETLQLLSVCVCACVYACVSEGSARKDCTAHLTDQRGAIMHMDYAAYDNCSWTIQAQPQHIVNISIRYTLHMTQHDVITVYDGPSMRSRILYRLYQHSAKAGYRHSVSVQSTGSNLTVNFQSGSMPGNRIGFVATYTGEPLKESYKKIEGYSKEFLPLNHKTQQKNLQDQRLCFGLHCL